MTSARTYHGMTTDEDSVLPASTFGGRTWFVGHWGFQFYAERHGWHPVVPAETRFQPDDWLVLPDARLDQVVVHR